MQNCELPTTQDLDDNQAKWRVISLLNDPRANKLNSLKTEKIWAEGTYCKIFDSEPERSRLSFFIKHYNLKYFNLLLWIIIIICVFEICLITFKVKISNLFTYPLRLRVSEGTRWRKNVFLIINFSYI